MPEIRKKPKKSKKRKPKSERQSSKLITGDKIEWESTTKKEINEEKTPLYQKIGIGIGITILIMFCLYFFVPDEREMAMKRKFQREREAQINKTREANRALRKDYAFNNAILMDSIKFTETLQKLNELPSIDDDDMDINDDSDSDNNSTKADNEFENIQDRILLVVFDDSTKENEGNPLKVKLFRKFESMAKSLPRKRIFKRYETNELPMVILFDCGNNEDTNAEQLCSQIVGMNNLPQIIIFRSQMKPRTLPSEYKSENQVTNYLYELMQPAGILYIITVFMDIFL